VDPVDPVAPVAPVTPEDPVGPVAPSESPILTVVIEATLFERMSSPISEETVAVSVEVPVVRPAGALNVTKYVKLSPGARFPTGQGTTAPIQLLVTRPPFNGPAMLKSETTLFAVKDPTLVTVTVYTADPPSRTTGSPEEIITSKSPFKTSVLSVATLLLASASAAGPVVLTVAVLV
jgi:hypothetical protein